jgi:hypothetical protein
MKITEYTNDFEMACVLVEYDDGSSWSGLKSAYDEMITQQEENN